MGSRVCAALAATAIAALPCVALPGGAWAQFPPPPAPRGTPPSASVQDRWPDPPGAQQAAPAPAAPRPAPAPAAEEPLQTPTPKPAAKPAVAKPPAPRATPAATVVTCGGVFAKDTTHLKLATKYDSRNVVSGDVDGPDGTKIPASIIFPNDSRRRLEVLWKNDAARTDPSVISINGKSQWTAPKGLKLGMPLATVEKLNGRPFKLSGIAADGTATVAGWEGGALGSIPGGCQIGMRLSPASKTPDDARAALAADKQFLSNDATIRAVKPSVMEILIGY
jgi:hypothetical protein